jgi:hypothetical protein
MKKHNVGRISAYTAAPLCHVAVCRTNDLPVSMHIKSPQGPYRVQASSSKADRNKGGDDEVLRLCACI